MSVFVPVAAYIEIAKISQYLMYDDFSKQKAFSGGELNDNYVKLLYCVRQGVEFAFCQNPNDPTLNQTALYMYSLCGKYALQATNIVNGLNTIPLPSITNPNDVSVQAGQSATFSVTVTSTISYTLQWYRDGVNIPGATGLTYTIPVTVAGDNGSHYSVMMTSAAGVVSTTQALLTVAALVSVQYWFGDVDNFAALSAGVDNITYTGSVSIIDQQAITINWPLAAANNKYQVIRQPISQYLKRKWVNTVLNQGTIPDSVFQAVSFPVGLPQYQYILSRVAMSLDGTNTQVVYT